VVRLIACPLSHITSDIWHAIDAADDADRGLLPVAGGTLAQTAVFVQAWRRVRAEVAHHKAVIRQREARHG